MHPKHARTHIAAALAAKGVDSIDSQRIAADAVSHLGGDTVDDMPDEHVTGALGHALTHDEVKAAQARVAREAPLRARAGVTSVAPAHELSVNDMLKLDAVNPATADARARSHNPHG